jgi:hypothetical protein
MPDVDRAAGLVFTVTDVKQWAYCQRIPFYRYVLPVKVASTYPMERGKDVQGAVEALERRRGFRAYGESPRASGGSASGCTRSASGWPGSSTS